MMRLVTEDGTELVAPDAHQLEEALSRLGLTGNGFAILGQADQVYIQTSGSRADGYVVEYREGSEREHYSLRNAAIPHAQMLQIFVAYLHGADWKALAKWKRGLSGGGGAGARPSRESKIYTWGLRAFFALGVALLFAAVYSAIETRHLLERAVKVPGTVVDMIQYRRGSSTYYSPVVRYKDHRGQMRTLFRGGGSNPPAFYVGEDVVVVYDPADADFARNAKIGSFGGLWGSVVVMLAIGFAFTGIPAVHWRQSRPKAASRHATRRTKR